MLAECSLLAQLALVDEYRHEEGGKEGRVRNHGTERERCGQACAEEIELLRREGRNRDEPECFETVQAEAGR